MEKVTLENILSELKGAEIRTNRRFDRLETRMSKGFAEIRGEMDLRFKQVDSRFKAMDQQIDQRFKVVDQQFKTVDQQFKRIAGEFKEVRRDLKVIREQTAVLTERDADTKLRLRQLERAKSGNA
jgi:hypothetical protein